MFEQNPELSKIGSKKQYSQYTESIFPESKIKDIVYHGTGEKFDEFDINLAGKSTRGFKNAAFFTNNKKWAMERFALADIHMVWGKEGVVLPALLNINKPSVFETVFDFNKSIEEGVYENLEQKISEKLRDIFPAVKSGKIFFVVNLDKNLVPKFTFVDENQRVQKNSSLGGTFTVPKEISEDEYLESISDYGKESFIKNKQKLNELIFDYKNDINNAINSLSNKTPTLSGNEDSVIQTQSDNITKEFAVFKSKQIHILGSKSDIEGFKKFVEENKVKSKEISETETVEDSYMANFDPDGEFNFAEYDDILRQIDGNESEFDLNEDILSIDEKKEGLNLSFANLTKTLIYQHNDIKNELQNLYGQLKDAKTKDRPAIKSKIAKTNQKRQELVDKIKESKKLSNLEQLLQFGNDAINEVSQILSEGGLTDKQLNYLKRITDF